MAEEAFEDLLACGMKTTSENTPDNTGRKQVTRFQSGKSGNPAGRPRGARNKHSENFINAFAQDFEQHGAEVIEKVRAERPQDYLKIAASLLPKQMELEANRTRPAPELTDAELNDLILDGVEAIVEAILISRGHASLTTAERGQIKEWEEEVSSVAKRGDASGQLHER